MSSTVPLTTTYSPAPSCLTDVYTTTTGLFGYLSLGPPEEPTQCFPSSWQPTSQFYSPGICPSGYAVACSSTNGFETQATCCPSSFSCQTSTNWPQYSTMACTAMVSDLPDPVTEITSGTSVMSIELNAGGGINAFGVSIRWRADDFTTTEATSTASTSTQNPTATNTQLSQETTSPDQSGSDSNSDGLSTGAKAGIGVGAAVAGLALIAILFFIFIIKRSRRSKLEQAKHELPTDEISKQPLRDSKSNAGQHELYGDDGRRIANNGLGPVELDSGFQAAELPEETTSHR